VRDEPDSSPGAMPAIPSHNVCNAQQMDPALYLKSAAGNDPGAEKGSPLGKYLSMSP
jgi:hypothetical protein